MALPHVLPHVLSSTTFDEYPTYSIAVDWNADGDWTDGNEDVTDDVAALAGVAIQYGRDQSQPLAATASGNASMELDNVSEKYTPTNKASTLYGLLLPGRPVRMQVTINGVTYSLFVGHTDDSSIDPDAGAQSVQLTMLDALAKIRGQSVTTGLYRGLRTGDAINLVLDAIGWPSADRDIDTGATVLPWWWVADQDAYEALTDLVSAEGPPALLSVGSSGEIIFRDRHHRVMGTSSKSVQAIWSETDMADKSTVALPWSDVVNHVEFEVEERRADGELSAVWSTEDIITVADGETKVITAKGSDPFIMAQTPVEDVDYILQAGTVTISLSRTEGQVTQISIHASGGPAVLNGLALRAYAISVRARYVVSYEDTDSIAAYGRRSWPNDAPFAGLNDVRAQAQLILAQRAQPTTKLTARFVSVNATELAYVVSRDLSDRIEIIGNSALTGQFFVESISHRFDGRVGHETVLFCESVPTVTADVFILGSATDGVIGTNKLGRTAVLDADNLFVLGSATNGKLGTNLMGF